MFEDLDNDSGFNPQTSHQPTPPVAPQTGNQPPVQSAYSKDNQSYNNPPNSGGYNNNNQGGGYQQKSYNQKSQGGGYSGGGGGGGFQRKEDVLQDAYMPVSFYVEKEFPEEVKNQIFDIASKMIAKKMTVRINGDDKVFIDRLKVLTDDKLEVYVPWRGFNEIDSKRTFNTITSKHIASQHFMGWDKIPDSVKAIIASQVRLVFGDRNNSIALCLITWSRDGASKASEVTKDTGRGSFIIKMASSFGFPILNLMRPQTQAVIDKTFSL